MNRKKWISLLPCKNHFVKITHTDYWYCHSMFKWTVACLKLLYEEKNLLQQHKCVNITFKFEHAFPFSSRFAVSVFRRTNGVKHLKRYCHSCHFCYGIQWSYMLGNYLTAFSMYYKTKFINFIIFEDSLLHLMHVTYKYMLLFQYILDRTAIWKSS